MKKTHSQLSRLVRRPPNRTPAAAPAAAEGAPDTERLGPLRAAVGRRDDRQRAGRAATRAPSPCSARDGDQNLGGSRRGRCVSEAIVNSAETGHEDAPAAEQIRHPAAEQEQTAGEEDVGGDHPLQIGRTRSQIACRSTAARR